MGADNQNRVGSLNAVPLSPLEQLLTSGGDTRLDTNLETGCNRYACGCRPGDVIPFGSCTSSTVSQLGFAAAEIAAGQIFSSTNRDAAANELAATIRNRLRELLTLPNDVDIALAPSGTDVEFLALLLAAGGGNRRVVNILVGPSETGSGTPLAAAGCHYESRTPDGRQAITGQPVDPILASRVDVRTVDLRTPQGDMFSESQIDASVIEPFLEAADADAIVLVHLVAHSKTGVHAPSLACIDRLRKTSDDVAVVIDAAQGRFSRRGLRDVLQKDCLVMFTGSKFYGGPPFSGALLVPPRFRPDRRGLDELPAGFRAYFSAAEMPESWPEVRQSLSAEPNIGLLLRWSAAIAEMDAYYHVPSNLRLQVLRFFEREVPKIFGRSNVLRLLPVFPPLYDDLSHRLLESKTTVFGFWVMPPGDRAPLDKAELKKLHFELASAEPTSPSHSEREILSRQFHLGQPVDLGRAGSILRVAIGGPLITRVATDPTIGASFDDRLAWLHEQIHALRRKIECLAKRYSPTGGQVDASNAMSAVLLGDGATALVPASMNLNS
jgi:hypothetical protein